MAETLSVVTKTNIIGHEFNIYGTVEEPLFLAKDVAALLDYAKRPDGSYQTSILLKMVDLEENKCVKNVNAITPGNHNMWFVTEAGLYDILYKARHPRAVEFRAAVSNVLKSLRLNGGYICGQDNIETEEDEMAFLSRALEVSHRILARKEEERKALALKNTQLAIDVREAKEETAHITHIASAYQHNFPWKPSILGKQFGILGKDVNKIFAANGFIYKDPRTGVWIVTESGKPYAWYGWNDKSVEYPQLWYSDLAYDFLMKMKG